MANEVTYTGSGGNLRAAEVFNRMIWETLVDKTDIRQTCTRLGDLSQAGSTALETGTVAFDDPMGDANADETTAADNTALGNGNITCTIAHRILAYGLSDLFSVTGAPGMLQLQTLAAKMVDAYILKFTDQIAALFPSVTAQVGTTTVDMTVDDFYDAIFTLEQAVAPGPFYAGLYTVQWTDLQASLRGEGGPNQFRAATQEALDIKGPGYKGNLFGVDVYAMDSVTAVGGDSSGAMWAQGAFGYVEASPTGAMPGSIAVPIPSGSPVYAEFDRVADPGISRVVGHAFNGVVLAEDARAVEILTDR